MINSSKKKSNNQVTTLKPREQAALTYKPQSSWNAIEINCVKNGFKK